MVYTGTTVFAGFKQLFIHICEHRRCTTQCVCDSASFLLHDDFVMIRLLSLLLL